MPAITISQNWITRRNYDLAWYLASVAAGYAMVVLNLGLGVHAMLLWWFWIVAADGPHIFGTLSRTYLDKSEWSDRSPLLLGSLLWFLPGPIAVALGIFGGSRLPFLAFLTLAQLWAYWHVVRQHYGFLALYQKKNGESSGRDNRIDYWVFYIVMLAPFVSFILRHPDARPQLALPPEPFPAEAAILSALKWLTFGALALYAAKEIVRTSSGQPLNLPKNLFLAACVPFHLLLFFHPKISPALDIRFFAMYVTFYHNIQYHGIVWFYNRNRYAADVTGEKFGAASRISRNFLSYYAAGILFTLLYRYPDWFFVGLSVPFLPGPNAASELALGSLFTVSDLAIGLWWGFALHHYFLDQKIWRLKSDARLLRDLKVA